MRAIISSLAVYQQTRHHLLSVADVDAPGAGNVEKSFATSTFMQIPVRNRQKQRRIMTIHVVSLIPDLARIHFAAEDTTAIVGNDGEKVLFIFVLQI